MPDVKSETSKPGWLPPEWFRRAAWRMHRGIYRLTGGRLGLWRPKRGGWGALLLTTTGRRTGRSRSVILGYIEEGPALVVLAMNGWMEGEPSWWLNLQADPDAVVLIKGEGRRRVRARAAMGEERHRLWARWTDITPDLDGWSAQRSTEASVVVLQPVMTPGRSETTIG